MIKKMQSEYRNLKNFKVLVGTPHADVKNYCLNNYINSVKSLSYKNKNVLVVDNSIRNKNAKLIQRMGVDAVHIKRKNKSTRQVLAESMEYLRTTALDKGYDWLLVFESDLIPPMDVIERLLSHQLPVISACYHIGLGENSHLMIQEREMGVVEPKTINMTAGADGKYMDGKLHEVHAAGLGMTLIHRDILKQIEFKFDPAIDAHPDTFFAADLAMKGIKQYVDSSILCHHDNRSWEGVENK